MGREKPEKPVQTRVDKSTDPVDDCSSWPSLIKKLAKKHEEVLKKLADK